MLFKLTKPFKVSNRVVETIEKFIKGKNRHLTVKGIAPYPNAYAIEKDPKELRHSYLRPSTIRGAFDDLALRLSKEGVEALNVEINTKHGKINKVFVIPLDYDIDKLKRNLLKDLSKETDISTLLNVASELQTVIDIKK